MGSLQTFVPLYAHWFALAVYNTYLEATYQLQDKEVHVDRFSRGTVENQKGDIYSVFHNLPRHWVSLHCGTH